MTWMRLGRALAIGAALALSACGTSADLQTTSLDAERALTLAQDPWAAPEDFNFPSALYGGSSLLREIGTRTRTFPGTRGHEAMLLEIRAAEEVGWRLAGLECESHSASRATLTRGDGLDDGARAQVIVEGDQSEVRLLVPHHLDGEWPDLAVVSVEDTCAAGGDEAAPLPEALPFGPIEGPSASPSLDDFSPWQRTTTNGRERAVLDVLNNDPYLSAHGLTLTEPTLREGDSWRHAISARAELATEASGTGAAIAEVVQEAGWEVTWASCGAGLPTVATARIPDAGASVTARLTSSDPAAVQVSVTGPVPEGPLRYPEVDEAPQLSDSECLSVDEVDSAFVIEGTPVAMPTMLHPYLAATHP